MQFSRLLYFVLLGKEAFSRLNNVDTVVDEFVKTAYIPLGNNSISVAEDSEQAIDQNHQVVTKYFEDHGYNPDSIDLLHELLGELKEKDRPELKKTRLGRTLGKSRLTGLDFTANQVATAINMQNILRRKIADKFQIPNMNQIQLDPGLQEAEMVFVKLFGAIKWLYEDSPVPPPFWENHRLNFEYLSNNSTFRTIAANNPNMLRGIDKSNLLNMHDTSSLKAGSTATQKLKGALLVLALRYVQQYNCFVLENCNRNEFDNFKNCFLPIQACTRGNGWQYLGSAVYPHNDAGTFVFMAAPGRFAPVRNPRQTGSNGYSFLFTHSMPKKSADGKDTWPPLTGSPFTKFGTPGSQCPVSHPYNNAGLCGSTPIVATQIEPSKSRGLRSTA